MKLTFKSLSTIKLLATALLPVVLTQVSCTKKFEEFNTNPHELTDSLLQYDFKSIGGFLPSMQTSLYNTIDWQYQLQQNLNGDLYSGYMAVPTPFNSGKNNSNYFMMDWNNWPFKIAYDNVMSGWKLIKDRGEQLRPDLYAVATIVKVLAMHRVTDVYGPLPYSKFGAGGFSASYDSQEAIYTSFFQELDAAIAKLVEFDKNNPGASAQLRPFDLIYNGSYTRWIRLANSLKLRLALRVVYVNKALAKTKAEEAVKHAYGVITDNADNAFVQSGNGITVSNSLFVISQEYNDVRMNAAMESILGGYKDPRMAVYFRTAKGGGYKGIRNGIDIRSKEDYTGFSGINVERNTPIKVMNAAEVYFLRAEGALWGWDMKGNEQALYEQGISSSFEQYRLGSASAYIADNTSVPQAYTDPVNPVNNTAAGTQLKIAWNSGASFEEKQERVLTQKWISVFPDGQEAWSEFRRTGYPKLWLNVVNYSGGTITGFIKRLPFPPDEYKNNGDEVTKAVALLGGPDNGGTRLWWDKK